MEVNTCAQTTLSVGTDYNSGYSGTGSLTPGTSDSDVQIVQVTPDANQTVNTPTTPFTPVVPTSLPASWVVVSGAQFVAPTANQTYSPPSDVQGNEAGTYDYRMVLHTAYLAPTTLTLTGYFAADDTSTVSVNGGSALATTPGFSSLTPFTGTFTVGTGSVNTDIDFNVINNLDYADGSNGNPTPINPTGLLVSDLEVSAVPEPSSWVLGLAALAVIGVLRRRALQG